MLHLVLAACLGQSLDLPNHAIATVPPSQLGLGAGDALVVDKVIPLKRGSVVRLSRTHAGIPVVGEGAALRLDDAGKVIRIRSDFAPLDVDVTALVSPDEAAGLALGASVGGHFPPLAGPRLNDFVHLVIDGPKAALVYRVLVPGITSPLAARVVTLSATTGAIVSVTSPTKAADTDASVFEVPPAPSDTLEAPTTVTLDHLDQPVSVTSGDYTETETCLTDDASVRVITCQSALSGTPYEFGCTLSPDLQNILVAFCGQGHLAPSTGSAGFVYAAHDDVSHYGDAGIFSDPFAEVQAYYHIDRLALWLSALGFNAPDRTMALVNVSVPTQELVACATAAWAATPSNQRTDDNARAVVANCTDADSFGPSDNALYLYDDPSDAYDIPSLLGINGGLYVGQGTTADFAYDSSVLYHELGHGVAFALNALGGGQLLEAMGPNDAPLALHEGYGDYFSAAAREDGDIGPYVGGRLGFDGPLRTLDHELACPNYWAGEPHVDSQGFAGALWAARALYDTTETDGGTGLEVRVFDRVVLQALAMLTPSSDQNDAAQETIDEVKTESALGDATGADITQVFTDRNVIACERARSLTDGDVSEVFLGAGGGSQGGIAAFLGETVFDPFAPGPVQLTLDVSAARSQGCSAIEAFIGQPGDSLEQPPELPIGEDAGDTDTDIRLIRMVGAPVTFDYTTGTGEVSVSVIDGEDPIAMDAVTEGNAVHLTYALDDLPESGKVYYAIGNWAAAPVRLVDVALVCSGQPNNPNGDPDGDDDDGGCQSVATSPALVVLVALLLSSTVGSEAWNSRDLKSRPH